MAMITISIMVVLNYQLMTILIKCISKKRRMKLQMNWLKIQITLTRIILYNQRIGAVKTTCITKVQIIICKCLRNLQHQRNRSFWLKRKDGKIWWSLDKMIKNKLNRCITWSVTSTTRSERLINLRFQQVKMFI